MIKKLSDRSIKWVCENHPSKEQGHRVWLIFHCGGAGMPKHTCGSWPDPFWTREMYENKKELQKDCLACYRKQS